MRYRHVSVGVLVSLLFVFASSRNVYAETTQEVKPHCVVDVDQYDFERHALAFQACADMTVKNSAGVERHVPVFAPCGNYVFDRQVTMINVPLFMPLEDGCEIYIYASQNLGNQRVLFFYSVVRSEVARIVVDGQRLERMDDSIKNRLSNFPDACTSDETRPANVEFHGSGLIIHDFVSKNALCGACMGVRAEGLWMWDTVVEKCGFDEYEELEVAHNQKEKSHRYGDGITFIYCNGCIVTRTTVKNISDLGFVFGGGENNHFYDNWCIQEEGFGFACFNWGRFFTGHRNPATSLPYDGNHKGTIFERNHAIARGRGTLIFGMAVGKDFFESNKSAWLVNVGTIRNSWSTGAQIPFAVDGIEEGIIENIFPSGARGVRKGAFNHCGESKNYTAGHVGSKVRLQGGFNRITFDGGVCEKY